MRTIVFGTAVACLALCWACGDAEPELEIQSTTQKDILGPPSGLPYFGTYTLTQPYGEPGSLFVKYPSDDVRFGTEFDSGQDEWDLIYLGALVELEQVSSSRYLDAYEDSSHDYNAVTRSSQDDGTQYWFFRKSGAAYTIQQWRSERYLDAYESSHDHSVVTRTKQSNDTQRWSLSCGPWPTDPCTIRQVSTGRYLDAYASSNDHSVVTREYQDNDTQKWNLRYIGPVYAAYNKIGYLDAYESGTFQAVVRSYQENGSQMWLFHAQDTVHPWYSITQMSSQRQLVPFGSYANTAPFPGPWVVTPVQ